MLSTDIRWEIDPEDVGWFRASFDGSDVYLRLNNFPDENLLSLWVGDGRYVELEDPPSGWTLPPGLWPSSARSTDSQRAVGLRRERDI